MAPLQRYLGRRCRSPHDVQDALQETLLRAARYRRTDLPAASLRSWALSIAANVLRDQSRRRLRGPSVGHEEAVFHGLQGREPDPSETDQRPPMQITGRLVEMDQLVLHLQRALRGLPSQDQEALRLFYDEERSTQATARRMQLSTNLVKVRLFRARQRLRRQIELSLARSDGDGRQLAAGLHDR